MEQGQQRRAQPDRHTDRHTGRHTDRQAHRQAHRQTHRQAGTQTGTQAGTHRHKRIDIDTCCGESRLPTKFRPHSHPQPHGVAHACKRCCTNLDREGRHECNSQVQAAVVLCKRQHLAVARRNREPLQHHGASSSTQNEKQKQTNVTALT